MSDMRSSPTWFRYNLCHLSSLISSVDHAGPTLFIIPLFYILFALKQNTSTKCIGSTICLLLTHNFVMPKNFESPMLILERSNGHRVIACQLAWWHNIFEPMWNRQFQYATRRPCNCIVSISLKTTYPPKAVRKPSGGFWNHFHYSIFVVGSWFHIQLLN